MSGKLTLGPVLFNWAPDALRDFYYRIADEAPLDSVYLGEIVCSKRAPFFEPHIDDVCERLRRAGKEVVRSTTALVMTEREQAAIRDIAQTDGRWLVEANDMSCIGLMAGRRHVVGPFVNVYNEATLGYLVGLGAVRVCLPAELSATSLAALAGATEAEIEVQVFGRLPLAVSARCYHARAHDLTKDGCRYVCAEDPDGLDIDSLDGEPFLTINGTQTLSSTYCSLLGELDALREAGIAAFRLWPHHCDMVAVASLFRDVLDGRAEAAEAEAQLAELVDGARFSNGFYYGEEGIAFSRPAR